MAFQIKIAIVDELPSDQDRLLFRLASYAREHSFPWEIDCFSDGETFLGNASPGAYQAVFLDILMNGIDGMETAVKLRSIDPDVAIIFVTTEANYALEGYEVQAAGFLVKGAPDNDERFSRLMSRLSHRFQTFRTLHLSENNRPLEIPIHSILYAEVRDHRMEIHTGDRVYRARMSIEEFKEEIGKEMPFFECHRGVILQLDAIETLDNGLVTLKNGDSLPVSRRRRTDLLQAYTERTFEKLKGE